MSGHPALVSIGGGNMAEAILSGLARGGHPAERLLVSEPLAERREVLRATHGWPTCAPEDLSLAGADVVLLAVKPQIMPTVLPGLDPGDALVLSIAAGLTCATLESMLPAGTRVVRAMPNTPALVGRGVSGLAAGTRATEEDLALAERLMGAVGRVLRVEEPMLDAVTALSGSGPAYVFYWIEAMLAGGRALGVPGDTARSLVLETVAGAAELMAASGESAEELRRRVTSKGGTTAAAVAAFDEHGVRAGIEAGVRAAHARSMELSGGDGG